MSRPRVPRADSPCFSLETSAQAQSASRVGGDANAVARTHDHGVRAPSVHPPNGDDHRSSPSGLPPKRSQGQALQPPPRHEGLGATRSRSHRRPHLVGCLRNRGTDGAGVTRCNPPTGRWHPRRPRSKSRGVMGSLRSQTSKVSLRKWRSNARRWRRDDQIER
jgi:hypothetical protein